MCPENLRISGKLRHSEPDPSEAISQYLNIPLDGSSKIMPVTGITSYFLCVVFSPDGRYIAGSDLNGSLWIWDSRRQKLVAKWPGHTSIVWCVEFTPDGRRLMSGSNDWIVKYWDMASLGSDSEWKSFPEIRRFSGHTVRLFCLLLAST